MVDPPAQPIKHCPLYPEHCSHACMERMRAQFGSYTLNSPPFEEWCAYAKDVQLQEEERRRFEADKLAELHQRFFGNCQER